MGVRQALWIIVGSISLGLGILGIVLPLLPTTPFLLLAAACYLRGSNRLHDWLLSHKILGGYIRNYREGRGISAKAKAIALVFLWATILYSALYIIGELWIRAVLLLIAAGVSAHIIRLPTLKG